jgi:23S rRNA pseudouridine955/2504/2580 synthase/23S rRNA pseudouridine1911/1915/1917 synthase
MGKDKESWRLRFRVSRDKVGVPLLDFLAARFPFFPRADWHERLNRDSVLVNGRPAPPAYLLQFRDTIEYAGWDIPEPDVPRIIRIVHEDADLLVVDKPAGLPCHPGGRYRFHTVWAVLRASHGVSEPILVNRLDRETSGLMLVAKTRDVAARCQKQFAGRTVHKRYAVLVEGLFPSALRAVGHIVADEASPVCKRRIFLPEGDGTPPDGDWAATTFSLQSVHGPVSLITAEPETGRLHQIRATLAALGYPVVGDKLYGADPGIFLRFCDGRMTDDDRALLRMDRQALHAGYLAFRHPRTRAPLEFSAPLPPDMSDLIGRLDPASP